MVDVIFQRNCVYQTAYHVVWCPKYRKSILTGKVAETLSEVLDDVCAKRGFTILSKEIQPDHVHFSVSIPPAVSVAEAVKIFKGASARTLFVRHPELKKQLRDGHLWSPSYYVGTAGNVNAETIRKYIERTEHIQGRR